MGDLASVVVLQWKQQQTTALGSGKLYFVGEVGGWARHTAASLDLEFRLK